MKEYGLSCKHYWIPPKNKSQNLEVGDKVVCIECHKEVTVKEVQDTGSK